jgi:cyclopropane fatty-acyl-phospholipid synthase-like methyltransferase
VILEWEVFRAARDGLLQAVLTGEPAFSHVFGHGLFEHLAKHPALSRAFDAHMADLSDQAAAGLLEACRFAPTSRIVDVGGGSGALLAHILRTYPQAHGVVFDLPPVAEGAKRHLAALGLASRCEVVGGDFLLGVPPGDTYLLSHVLHNWDDDRCARILGNCRAAMEQTGRVLVFERLMPERITKLERATEADVDMLVLTGGRERTEGEYRSLFAVAGLELTRVLPTPSPRCVLEGSPAAS